jgi:hypothetical protein
MPMEQGVIARERLARTAARELNGYGTFWGGGSGHVGFRGQHTSLKPSGEAGCGGAVREKLYVTGEKPGRALDFGVRSAVASSLCPLCALWPDTLDSRLRGNDIRWCAAHTLQNPRNR